MKPIMIDGVQTNDHSMYLFVEVDGENTALTFENEPGTMQSAFVFDRGSLQWLRETLKKASKLTQNPERKE